uniref:Chromosome 1 open reading frame 141 n=1 Tax=Catagonus wagneri TaxID=51154 RepID=A0A8C3W5A3_9CETA
MAEKILQQLDILDEQAKTLLAKRAKKNCLQSQVKKKISAIPLTFDFQLEFEKAVATSISETESKMEKVRAYGIQKTKSIEISFVSLEPAEGYLRSRSIRSFCYLKDTTEAENAKPFPELHSQHRRQCRRALGPTILFPVSSMQPNASKKEKPLMNDYNTKENKNIEKYQLNEYSVRKKSLLPLCFEDELKNPDAKIISISPAKTVTSHMEHNDTNPIIFHKTDCVQMFLLTKNRLPPHSVEKGTGYLHKRSNVVLERNCEMFKSVVRGQSITPSKLKSTMPTTQRKYEPAIPFEVGRGHIEDKLRKKTSMHTFENVSWNKFYSFSQTFSSLTKKFVGFLDKTVIQEKVTKTSKFEKMFSTLKPTSKFSASPVKYCSKPSKNILKVHKINGVTPLDDLLNLSSTN